MKVAAIVLVFVLCSKSSGLGAAVSLVSRSELAHLDERALLFLDATGGLSAEEVLSHNKWLKYNKSSANFTFARGVVWLLFDLQNNTRHSAFIKFKPFSVNRVTIYTIQGNKISASPAFGFGEPYRPPYFSTAGFLVEIPESANRLAHRVLCRIELLPGHTTVIRPSVGTLDAQVHDSRRHEFVSLLILGVLIVMLFYNLVLLFMTKESYYFLYCVYLLVTTFAFLWFTGFIFEYAWPKSPSVIESSWPTLLYFVFQILFINKLLNVREHASKLHLLSKVLLLICASTLLCTFISPIASLILILLISAIQPLFYVGVAIWLFARGHKIALIFLTGWLPLFFITLIDSLITWNVFSDNTFFDLHGLEIGIAWEVVMFSIALGYRYTDIKQETIRLQKENLELVRDKHMQMEKMVSERTEELLAQHEELVQKQNQIQQQNRKLEAQNKAFEKLRELVIQQNHDLEKAVRKRTLDLDNANQELKNTLRLLERFNYIIAHNLRGPVARIMGLAQLLARTEQLKGRDTEEIVERLIVSTKDLDTVIHDLIFILDIQSQKEKKLEKIVLAEAMQQILDKFYYEIQNFGFEIELSMDVNQLSTIRPYFDNIFSNLISNSIRFRSVSGNKISISISQFKRHIIINYRDRSIGFDSVKYKEKLFEPFQKFHAVVDGKGLGLFLIKSQVTVLGGIISLKSARNEGVHVKIVLPLNIDATADDREEQNEVLSSVMQPSPEL